METLVIIDEQNDFVNPTGSLYVKGSPIAVTRTVEYIRENNPDQIVVTLDTHSPLHMDLKGSWNREFNELPCFEPDPKDSMYGPEIKVGGFPLVVWPDHCLKGTWGHSLPERLSTALIEWSLKNRKEVIFIEKGMDPKKEMYSAFSSLGEEPIIPFPKTDKVTVCGVALDYCVKYSFLDLQKAGYKPKLLLDATAKIGDVDKYWEV